MPTAHTSSPCEEARYPASCACPWVNCCRHGAQACLYVCVQVVVIVPAKGTGTASSSRPNQHRRTAGTGCCGFCSRRAKVVAMYAVAVQVWWWCFLLPNSVAPASASVRRSRPLRTPCITLRSNTPPPVVLTFQCATMWFDQSKLELRVAFDGVRRQPRTGILRCRKADIKRYSQCTHHMWSLLPT